MQLPPSEGPKIHGQSVSQNHRATDQTARDEKTARLRQAIESGSYQVSTQSIAQKMLDNGILNN